jgi:GDPmannose 4,6-dehydratase
MWLMLQQDKPDDYVIATGEAHSVKEFAELAFRHAGLDSEDYLRVDETFYRPAEVQLLMGDYSKAKKILGWKPTVSFKGLIEMMVDSDLKYLKK